MGAFDPGNTTNPSVNGLAAMVVGAATFNETVIVCGEPEDGATVNVALYWPGAIPAAFTVTCTLSGVDPAVGFTESHGAPLVETEKFVELALITEIDCWAVATPASLLKLKLSAVGLTTSDAPALTVSVTLTDTGLPVAGVMAIAPL